MTDKTVTSELSKWFHKPLSKIPHESRLVAAAYIPRWGSMSPVEREARAVEIDRQRLLKGRIRLAQANRAMALAKGDSKQVAEGRIGWHDWASDAASWWALSDIACEEAAALLCGFNPHDNSAL